MAQSTILTLIPETSFDGENYIVTSEQFPASGYYLSNKDLQTVSWSVTQNMIGLLSIEATLVDDPADEDWFTVHSETFDSEINANAGGTPILGYSNIRGNFIYIRAKFVGFTQGMINHVKMVY